MRSARVLAALLTVACSSAGPYGFSRVYEPQDEEETALENTTEYDPVMVQRRHHEWKNKKVTLFGIVKSRREGPSGAAHVTLSMRALSNRNLCEDAEESTCRVTVSDREHGTVHALVKLTSDDDIGKERVTVGSLLRLVGQVTDTVDQTDGMPVLRVTYYRHWPYRKYVTTAASSYMLR
jgi:hypothetical protein